MQNICNFVGGGLGGSLVTLSALASFATVMIISISYMFGRFLSNPKVLLWAKTEIVQLFVSIAASLLLIAFISSFCTISFDSLHSLVDLPAPPSASGNVFDAAEQYLVDAAEYTHSIVEIGRFHLMGYNMLLMRGRYDCIYGPLLCLFGNAGTSNSPYSWASLTLGTVSLAFNTSLFAYMSILVSLFILFYSTSGFALFFIPLGIFFRSMPYLRSLGSLFLTISISFIVVYPALLSIFHLAGPVLFDHLDDGIWQYATDHSSVTDSSGGVWDYGDDSYIDDLFDARNDPIVYQLAGRAFVVGTFIPLLALLGTVASISYISKLLGEEIDFQRIARMV